MAAYNHTTLLAPDPSSVHITAMSEHLIVTVLTIQSVESFSRMALLQVPVNVDPVSATIVSPLPALSQADCSAEVSTVVVTSHLFLSSLVMSVVPVLSPPAAPSCAVAGRMAVAETTAVNAASSSEVVPAVPRVTEGFATTTSALDGASSAMDPNMISLSSEESRSAGISSPPAGRRGG